MRSITRAYHDSVCDPLHRQPWDFLLILGVPHHPMVQVHATLVRPSQREEAANCATMAAWQRRLRAFRPSYRRT